MATKGRFGGASWSLRLAPAWQGQHEEECATITGGAGGGALQVSAYRKQDAAVSDEDLFEFAEGFPAPTRTVSFGSFSGSEHALEEDGHSSRRWLLRSDRIMLFVTYNSELPGAGLDDLEVEAMLLSLRRVGAQ